MVSSAHCFYDKDGLRGPLSAFSSIKMGLSLNDPIDEIVITDIFCGTKDPSGNHLQGKELQTYNNQEHSETLYNDECVIVTNRLPRVRPIERKYLTVNEMNSMRSAGIAISLIGFHSLRFGESLYSKDGDTFAADRTRTIQHCAIQINKAETTGYVKRLFHNCDTLGNSSGAPITYWDAVDRKRYLIGIHKGYSNVHEKNFSVNVFISELVERD